VLAVDRTQPDGFPESDQQILQALAGHIAIAIENARAFQRERLERENMHRESEEARKIQEALFPKAYPLIPGFTFETAWRPAGAVAGDWFDFIDLGAGRFGIVLADVSGKGMPAALLMSATRAMLRTIAKLYATPGETLSRLNQILSEDCPVGKFVTMIYGILDRAENTLTLASAGHPRPLVVNGDCRFLELETGLPLGLGASPYPEVSINIKPGMHVLLYTDGISEAMNHQYEEYGPARLIEHFQNPEARLESLMQEVQRFTCGPDKTDDATAILIRRRVSTGGLASGSSNHAVRLG
jgi:sigma-B regulation protein RsbU (phosphoserine phosphatase)